MQKSVSKLNRCGAGTSNIRAVDQSGKRGLDKSARKQRKTLLQGYKTRTGQQGDQSRLKPQIKKSRERERAKTSSQELCKAT